MAKIIRTFDEAKKLICDYEGTVGIVPSLGNFHAGHQSLFKKSVEQNDITVVCLVLTPFVFNDYNDFH